MRLSLFRRRAIAPADLPPVSGASMPGPLHSGLTGSWPNAVMAGASVLAAAVASAEATHATKTTAPAPAPVATSWPDREPQPIPGPITGLAPLDARPLLWRPGTYTVTYSRIGDYGRRGTGLDAPMPLTAEALTVGDLACSITEDVHQLTGLTVTAMVDQAAGGGMILGHGGSRVGTFSYERRGGAAR